MPRNPKLQPLATKLVRQPGALSVPWPDRDPVLGGRLFSTFHDWHKFIDTLSLNATVPTRLAERWTRVQSAYLVSWLSPDLLVAADLISFTALEYAVMDRYGHLATPRPKYDPKKPNAQMRVSFAKALDYIVTGDGLTDAKLPFVAKYGGGVIGRLVQRNATRPTLPDIRNRLAHGEPLEPGPTSGLPELVRDLIDYAYRAWPEP
ncbi:hypothetical protein BH10PSE4_BH10PSE4_45990 [soil metagenome]